MSVIWRYFFVAVDSDWSLICHVYSTYFGTLVNSETVRYSILGGPGRLGRLGSWLGVLGTLMLGTSFTSGGALVTQHNDTGDTI